MSLFDPENDSDACRRRRKVGAIMLAQGLQELKNIRVAINNLAKGLGGGR